MKRKIVTLIKIVRCKEHAENLLDGILYCNTIRYMRDKFDKYEGTIFLQHGELTLQPADGGESISIRKEDRVGPITFQSNEVTDLNVFCMFSWCVPSDGDRIVVDLKAQLGSINRCVKEFGPHAVVVKNVTEFFSRVHQSVKLNKGNALRIAKRGLARYVDPETYSMSLDESPLDVALVKDQQFSHENEYRFVFQRRSLGSGPYCLRIGDIRDIAFYIETDKIYDSVQIKEKEPQ